MDKLFYGRKQKRKDHNSKTNSRTPFDCYSAYRGRSLHICFNFMIAVPMFVTL